MNAKQRRPLATALSAALISGCAIIAPGTAAALSGEQVLTAVAPSIVAVSGMEAGGGGSGIVIAHKVILTSCRVIGDARGIVVRQGVVRHAASRLSTDLTRDVCILEVATLESPPVTMGTASPPTGSRVYAIGAVIGAPPVISAGTISSIRRNGVPSLLQTTVPALPGLSGGGLFDERGRLVGLIVETGSMQRAPIVGVSIDSLGSAISTAEKLKRCSAAPEPNCLFEMAAAIARGLPELISRVSMLAQIGTGQSRAGDKVGADRSFAEALNSARDISDGTMRRRAFSRIALEQASSRHLGEAEATLSEMGDRNDDFWEASAFLAQRLAEAGDAPLALRTARTITDVRKRIRALGRVAIAQAATGDRRGASTTFNEAIAMALADADAEWRESLLQEVSQSQAMAGDVRAARATILRIEARKQTQALASIAGIQARNGDFDGALAGARRISSAYDRVEALRSIGTAKLAVGDFSGAQEILRIINVDKLREAENRFGAREVARFIAQGIAHNFGIGEMQLWDDIAAAQARAGDISGALATLRDINAQKIVANTTDLQPFALGAISAAQAASGDIAGALTTARGITMTDRRVTALGDIGSAIAASGDGVGAARIFREALENISRPATNVADWRRGPLQGDSANSAIRRVAVAQARSGDVGAALAVARGLSDPEFREATIAEIAVARASVGDGTSALIICQEIEGAARRAGAIAEVASELARISQQGPRGSSN